MRILVVEDEPKISAGISAALAGVGLYHRHRQRRRGRLVPRRHRGLRPRHSRPRPAEDGRACRAQAVARRQGRKMPVLILTARGAWPERVEGIDAGADDYLAKPFHIEELLGARAGADPPRGGARLACDRGRSARARHPPDAGHRSTASTSRCRRLSIASSPISCITRDASCSAGEIIEHLYGS